MPRESGPRLEARQQHAALVELVLPDPLLADAGARLDPRELTQREDLRGRRAASLGDRLNAAGDERENRDRKSTRLNSSHSQISYAVFCLKKKKTHQTDSLYMLHT